VDFLYSGIVQHIRFVFNKLEICFLGKKESHSKQSCDINLFLNEQNELPPQKLIHYASYALIIIMQILLIAYFGNEIQVKSAATFNAIFESDWINADKEYKKLCLIAMENMKKPIKLKAYRIFEVNLENFLFVS